MSCGASSHGLWIDTRWFQSPANAICFHSHLHRLSGLTAQPATAAAKFASVPPCKLPRARRPLFQSIDRHGCSLPRLVGVLLVSVPSLLHTLQALQRFAGPPAMPAEICSVNSSRCEPRGFRNPALVPSEAARARAAAACAALAHPTTPRPRRPLPSMTGAFWRPHRRRNPLQRAPTVRAGGRMWSVRVCRSAVGGHCPGAGKRLNPGSSLPAPSGAAGQPPWIWLSVSVVAGQGMCIASTS